MGRCSSTRCYSETFVLGSTCNRGVTTPEFSVLDGQLFSAAGAG